MIAFHQKTKTGKTFAIIASFPHNYNSIAASYCEINEKQSPPEPKMRTFLRIFGDRRD